MTKREYLKKHLKKGAATLGFACAAAIVKEKTSDWSTAKKVGVTVAAVATVGTVALGASTVNSMLAEKKENAIVEKVEQNPELTVEEAVAEVEAEQKMELVLVSYLAISVALYIIGCVKLYRKLRWVPAPRDEFDIDVVSDWQPSTCEIETPVLDPVLASV